MMVRRSVRIVKKVQEAGVWKFVSLARQGTRYLWDSRPGSYYLDWWEGRRRREYAGETPSAPLQAQRRKQHELAGALLMQDVSVSQNSRSESQPFAVERIVPEEQCPQTPIHEARNLFLAHVAAHSPDKPETHRRYRQVLEHFERHLGYRRFIEAVTRADMDEYKLRRCQEQSQRHKRFTTARTVNFEVSTLRTFFYYLIQERGLVMENPCSRFKKLRDAKRLGRSRPPTYSQEEMSAFFLHCTSLSERFLPPCC